MNKGIIFKYELRRLLLSKEYMLLIVTILIYSVLLLRSMVMYGANYTAPFSQLTFSTYCASLAPFLFVLLLVLCARQYKASECGAEAIISVAPMPIYILRLIRSAAILCAYLISLLLPVFICFAYYLIVFEYTGFYSLTWLCIVIILPSSLLLMGVALNLGKKKSTAVYVLLAAVLVLGVFNFSLPSCFDLLGSSVTIPLNSGTRNFDIPFAFSMGRAASLIIGIILITEYLGLKKRQNRRD